MSNIAKWAQLEQERSDEVSKLKAEHDSKLEKLRKDCEAKEGNLLDGIQDELANTFQVARRLLSILENPKLRKQRKALLKIIASNGFALVSELNAAASNGKVKKTRTGKPRGPRAGKLSESDFLEYLTTERQSGEITKHFKTTAPTVDKYLKPLLQAQKIIRRKDGRKVFWKKV
jgi:DNA-binding transcriptional ArsR family regulator